MSPDSPPTCDRYSCFPRVSGDEPWTAEGAKKHTTFSPRERGMRPHAYDARAEALGFPRVSGDEPVVSTPFCAT